MEGPTCSHGQESHHPKTDTEVRREGRGDNLGGNIPIVGTGEERRSVEQPRMIGSRRPNENQGEQRAQETQRGAHEEGSEEGQMLQRDQGGGEGEEKRG